MDRITEITLAMAFGFLLSLGVLLSIAETPTRNYPAAFDGMPEMEVNR